MSPKTLSAPILKKRGPLKAGFLKKLVVGDSGVGLSNKLRDFGNTTNTKAVVTPVITFDANSKIAGSRLVVRGPLFKVFNMKATNIWPEAPADLEVNFTVGGTSLKFNSENPNISDWVEIKNLQDYKVVDTEAGELVDQEQVDETDGMRNGACIRVVLRILSVKAAGAFLQVSFN